MDNAEALLKELRINRQPGPPKRRVPVWAWTVGGVVVLGLLYALLGGRGPVPVETATARAADDPAAASVLDASGYVTARRLATVSAKITGKVEEVLIEEGMRVEAGQVLARLDATDANAQRALSASQLAAARSQLTELQTQLAQAGRTLDRQQSLFDRQLIAQAALDQALLERDSLRARLESARRQVAVAEDGLALAAIAVDNTIIRAPFAGVVIAKAAQPGEMISPISAGGGFTRTGIGTIVDMDSLEVEVDVNEAYIGRVQPGQPIEAVLNAYPDWRIPGAVIAIIPAADRARATVKVRIGLEVDDPRVVPDMGVRVSFLEQARDPDAPPPSGVWLPARAVVERDGGSVVFVLAEGRVRQVPVSPGERRDADMHVPEGLAAGAVVVLSPPEGLGDGDRAQPRR